MEYGYDDDSRLTGLTYKDGTSPLGDLTYTYDAAGQRTSVGGSYARTGLPAALASASYDDPNQITAFGGVSFTSLPAHGAPPPCAWRSAHARLPPAAGA